MSDRDRFLHLTFGGRRLAPAVLACGISAALLLSLGTGALAAGRTTVVPPKGKIAGEGYAYWLVRSWQITFNISPPVKPCQTLTTNGQRVALLTLKTIAPGTDRYTCSEPAGRPMYAVELSNECSTFKGDHGNFGTSDSQLKLCARALFKGAMETTTVDGHAVNVSKLVAATGVYPVRVPKHNIVGTPPGKGRSAAYGYGLLLTGLAKGTHTIHTVASVGTSKWDVTFTVHAH
jgi:hypothetical protein